MGASTLLVNAVALTRFPAFHGDAASRPCLSACFSQLSSRQIIAPQGEMPHMLAGNGLRGSPVIFPRGKFPGYLPQGGGSPVIFPRGEVPRLSSPGGGGLGRL